MPSVSEEQENGAGAWLRARLQRHMAELVKLATPAMASRLGLLAMGFVDTVLVGHYATAELASLSLANRSIILLLLVIAIGLLMGVIVTTAAAFGRGDTEECGRVWRRTMPYAALIGAALFAATLPAHLWMRLLAHDPAIGARAATLVLILGLGLPAHVLFYCSTAFLEGIRRPYVPMLLLVIANGINVALDYGLIYGHVGLPELGAAGSAWATTAVRWAMLAMIVAYIWYAPSMHPFAVRRPNRESWRSWHHQRSIGYASAVSIAAEVSAFAGLAVIAEKLGARPLAGQEIVMNVLTVPFMFAVGIGSATAVRVGIGHGRGDRRDSALAGWTGLGATIVLLGGVAALIAIFPKQIFALHSDDPALGAITVPAIAFIAYVTVFDGGQAVISMGLRGLGETWWPTAIQALAYIGLMLPLSWYLAMDLDRGLIGLLEATLVASIFSVVAQSLRFRYLTAQR